MGVRVGSYTFEEVDYDAAGDVLYLGRRGIGDGDTPEGHVWLYPNDSSDEVIGLALINARALLERDGGLFVTLPDGTREEAPEAAELIG